MEKMFFNGNLFDYHKMVCLTEKKTNKKEIL